MSVPVRLAGFVVVVVAVLALALVVGRAVGPVGGDPATDEPSTTEPRHSGL